jgi:hypothetical protein
LAEDRGEDADLRDRILRLEERIEELTELIESCRKIILASRLVIAGGTVCLLVFALGATALHPAALVGGLAAIIGGTVLLGSNAETSKQARAGLKEAETLRAELIGRMHLRPVGRGKGNGAAPALR